ncbi:hypothetical protein ACFQV4_25865 [Streptomyces thermocarboxydus]
MDSGPPGEPSTGGAPRAEYGPGRFTLAQHEEAKAAELTAIGSGQVSRTTVQRMRLAYHKQGLRGPVDHRTTRSAPTPRAHRRTRSSPRPRRPCAASAAVPRGHHPGPETHGHTGPGRPVRARHGARTVPGHLLPARPPVRRARRTPRRPARTLPSPTGGRAFTPTMALRPGEQVQVGATRLDVLADHDDGTTGRPELTICRRRHHPRHPRHRPAPKRHQHRRRGPATGG